MALLALLFVVAAPGCGEECALEQLDGNYQISYVRTSGNCADLPTVVARYEKGNPVNDTNANLTINQYDWTQDECKLESSSTLIDAVDPDLEATTLGSYTSDDNGDSFSGTGSLRIVRLSTQEVQCYSVYDVTGVRL